MSNFNKKYASGRVAFLAYRDQCTKMLNAGYSQRAIYDEIGGEKKLGISYWQFNRYMNRYIANQTTDNEQNISGRTAIKSDPESLSTLNSTRAKPLFSHDPNSGNTRDDLI